MYEKVISSLVILEMFRALFNSTEYYRLQFIPKESGREGVIFL